MAYRIEYDRDGGKYEVRRLHPHRVSILWGGALGIFAILTWFFWPSGAAYLRDALIPGENAVTVQGVKMLADDLRSGAALGEAVESFCRMVIHGS